MHYAYYQTPIYWQVFPIPPKVYDYETRYEQFPISGADACKKIDIDATGSSNL